MTPRSARAVVVTHDSAGQVVAALTALRSAGIGVVVVDNASADATLALVRDRFPDAVVVANPGNRGFAAAVNQGLALVEEEVTLLVNPDCVLPPETAHALLDHLAAEPSVGVVGPRLVGTDGRVAVSAHPFETLRSVVLSRFGGALVPVGLRRLASGRTRRAAYDACRTGRDPVTVDWLSGACLAVRTDLLRATGGLDERYFLYYEDEELCWQARAHGLRVQLVPAVSAAHVGGASSETGETWPWLYASMLTFFAAHRPASYAAVRAVIVARSALGVALGTGRRLVGDPSGARRARAWRDVAAVARRDVPPRAREQVVA